MGDRCYLRITLKREDLDRFGAALGERPGATWWEEEEEAAPGIVEVGVTEANYAWYEDRGRAADEGIPFFGWHGEGGDYGSFAFVSLDGEHVEAAIDRDGYLVIQVDEDLEPITDRRTLRRFVKKRHAVEKLFGIGQTSG